MKASWMSWVQVLRPMCCQTLFAFYLCLAELSELWNYGAGTVNSYFSLKKPFEEKQWCGFMNKTLELKWETSIHHHP